MKLLFRRHPWLVSTFALATALTLFFGIRFALGVAYWSEHHKEPVQAWMTVGYVGRSWGISPHLIDETAGLPGPVHGRPLPLAEIARQRGVPVEDVIREVEAAITTLKAHNR